MEEERFYLEENSKLCSFHGIICRHDYILNVMYICIMQLIVTVPYMFWYMTNASTILDIYNPHAMIIKMPLLLKLWVFAGTAAILPISLSNMIRRLNDICGKVNKVLNGFAIAYCIITAFAMYLLPSIFIYLLSAAAFLIGLLLMCIPGAITSKKEYNVNKIFNWGAFLGTWIWGLFNKSYIPLWYLLLGWIPYVGFYFQIICGLKGNEWAFKNKKCTDVEEFNKSQKKQTTIWAVLTLVTIPIIYIALIILIVAGIAIGVAGDVKANGPEATATKFENFMQGFASIYFESHEITENENKYYILPSDWATYSFKEKKDLLDVAAGTAAMERTKKFPEQGTYHSKSTELSRTKIYSSKNGELLGEYNLDEKAMSSGSFKEAFKATFNAYHFYKPTEK